MLALKSVNFSRSGIWGNLVQGFRVYVWRDVPSFPQITKCALEMQSDPSPFLFHVLYRMHTKMTMTNKIRKLFLPPRCLPQSSPIAVDPALTLFEATEKQRVSPNLWICHNFLVPLLYNISNFVISKNNYVLIPGVPKRKGIRRGWTIPSEQNQYTWKCCDFLESLTDYWIHFIPSPPPSVHNYFCTVLLSTKFCPKKLHNFTEN